MLDGCGASGGRSSGAILLLRVAVFRNAAMAEVPADELAEAGAPLPAAPNSVLLPPLPPQPPLFPGRANAPITLRVPGLASRGASPAALVLRLHSGLGLPLPLPLAFLSAPNLAAPFFFESLLIICMRKSLASSLPSPSASAAETIDALTPAEASERRFCPQIAASLFTASCMLTSARLAFFRIRYSCPPSVMRRTSCLRIAAMR
mmetsp:Transcript_45177/g.98238  ORF Transcript_45177/g.98238 Transcript_45177/m.98238 type:complete len:205 (-) Transcript_45177:1933-2547(-)